VLQEVTAMTNERHGGEAQIKRVGVLGASGFVGSHLVEALVGAGYEVRAIARHLDALAGRNWEHVEIVDADGLELDSLIDAFSGLDAVYHLAHSAAGGDDSAARDLTIAQNVATAAARVGARRVIYLDHLQPPAGHAGRPESGRRPGELLRDGPVPVTELRTPMIVGAGSAASAVISDLVRRLPVMLTPRWVHSLCQPISLDDVLAYLVGVLAVDATTGLVYDLAGPEVLAFGDLLREFSEIVGRRSVLIPLPIQSPRLSAYWIDVVTGVPAPVVRPMIERLRSDLVADDEPIRELIPVRLQTYRQATLAAIGTEPATGLPARWAEGVPAFNDARGQVADFSHGATVTADTSASPESLWDAVRSVGGTHGWGGLNWAWRVRGAADRLIGGVGMRRGRRHPQEVRVGDAVDFWRVVSVEPGRRLTLLAEMKLPGIAVLELQVRPRDGGSTLVTTAKFAPDSLWGLLYWHALWPIHKFIFPDLTRAIVSRATPLVEKQRG
jgi:uncharacterized protein YbjT (DUF2867 family)